MAKVDAATLREMAALNEKAAQQLLDQYGSGVRPSWVSAELAIYWDRSARYIEQAEQLEAFQ